MRRALVAALGLLVSAAALLFTFAHVHLHGGLSVTPRFSWAALMAALRSAQPGWLLAFAVLNASSLVPRAAQLRALTLRRDGGRPSRAASWHATAIAMLAQNVLPARLGDAVRVVALTRADDVSMAGAIAGVVLERACDLVALLVVVCAPGLWIGRQDPAIGHALRLVLAIGGGLAIVLAIALLILHREGLVRLARRLRPSLGRVVASFATGIGVLAERGRRRPAIVASLAVPLWMAAAFACSLQAFGLGGLPTGASLLLVAAVLLAAALPSAPASIGVYDAAVIWLLRALGAPLASAAALALITHAIGVVAYVGLGLISLLRVGALTTPRPSGTDPSCAG